MNRILIFLVFICLNFLMVSCSLSPENTPSVELKLNKTVYAKEEKIDGEFSIINNTDDEMKFNFNDAKKYGTIISGPDNLSFEINRIYAQALTNLTISANDKIVFPITPILKNNDGQLLENGDYSIRVYFDIDDKPSSKANFKIE